MLKSGDVLLYRGVGEADVFRLFHTGPPEGGDRSIWRRYVQVQTGLLSDSVRSFNSIHDRAKRCETGHIRDGTWMSDDVARRHGLDIDADGFARDLWEASQQSFSLARHVAEFKFGPHYVVCKTPLDNIRLTTFFAGENEVRVVSPHRLVLLETHGCRVELSEALREATRQGAVVQPCSGGSSGLITDRPTALATAQRPRSAQTK